MLKRHHAPAFHAAEIVERNQIKDSRFKGWTFQQEVEIFTDATSILTDKTQLPNLQSIGFSVAVPDRKNIESQDLLWVLLFCRLLAVIVESDRNAISIMFDNKPGVRKIVEDHYDKAKKVIDSALPGKLARSTIGFGADEEVIPLQAADFFAYEWRKRISDKVKNPQKRVRKSYARLRQLPGHLEHYNRTAIEDMLDRTDAGESFVEVMWKYPASEE